jgi:hypothetical protein
MAFPTVSPSSFSNLHHHTGRYSFLLHCTLLVLYMLSCYACLSDVVAIIMIIPVAMEGNSTILPNY